MDWVIRSMTRRKSARNDSIGLKEGRGSAVARERQGTGGRTEKRRLGVKE